MKCVILFGGKGTRLSHRGFSNKAFIEINEKPIAYYIIKNLQKWFNNSDFIFITSEENCVELIELIENYFDFNPQVIIQKEPDGVPSAIYLANNYIYEDFCVCLGDFYSEEIEKSLNKYKDTLNNVVLLNKVNNPSKYGILYNGKIIEKPNYGEMAVRGFYVLKREALKLIPDLQKSKRNETEIVDLLNQINYETVVSELNSVYDLGSDEGLNQFCDYILTKDSN